MSQRAWNHAVKDFENSVCDIASEETNDRLRHLVKAARPSPERSVLVDLGCIVVHITQPAIRQYYNLEELWAPPPRARRRRAADGAAP